MSVIKSEEDDENYFLIEMRSPNIYEQVNKNTNNANDEDNEDKQKQETSEWMEFNNETSNQNDQEINKICKEPPTSQDIIEEDQSSPTPTAKNPKINTKPSLNLLDGKFFRYIPEKSTNNRLVAFCMKCYPLAVEVKGYGSCTSNFICHLKRRHGAESVEEYRAHIRSKRRRVNTTVHAEIPLTNQQIENHVKTRSNTMNHTQLEQQFRDQQSVTKKKSSTSTASLMEDNILNFFISTLISPHHIENPYFAKIINNDTQSLTQQQLETRIEAEFLRYKKDLDCELAAACSMSMSFIFWTAEKKFLVGAAVHWLTQDLNRRTAVLSLNCVEGTENNVNLVSKIVMEKITEFGLNEHKIQTTLIGAPKDYRKEFKSFGVHSTNIVFEQQHNVQESIMSDSDDEEKYLPDFADIFKPCLLPSKLDCAAQMLNTAVSITVEEILNSENNSVISNVHATTLKKCNVLWKAVGEHRADFAQKQLLKNLERPQLNCWRSLYNALYQVSTIKDRSAQLNAVLGINVASMINNNEFAYLHEYLVCTAPIMEALDILQSEKGIYYGILMPCLFALKRNLKKVSKKHNFTYCQVLLETYLANITNIFEDFFELRTQQAQNAAIAALSFPRFKNQWLVCVEPTSKRYDILNTFKCAVSEHICIKDTFNPKSVQNQSEQDTFFDFGVDCNDDIEAKNANSQHQRSLNASAESQVMQFFAEESTDIDILNNYPEIKNVFLHYNTSMPSLALSEKLFSSTTIQDLRKNYRNLSPLMEKRIILNSHLKMKTK